MAQELKIPAVGESITEATVGTWLKKDGEYVQKNEAVLEVETDKANVEIVSEYAGQLKIKVKEGETVEIGAVVAEIDTSVEAPAGAGAASGGATTSPEPEAKVSAVAVPSASSTSAPAENRQAAGTMSPAAQRIAGEAGLQASQIQATGKGGRISKQDAMQATSQPAAQSKAEPAVAPPPRFTGEQVQERVKITRLRKKIAERLVASQHNTATLTTFNDVDMTAILDLRAKYKEGFKEKYGVSLGFMGFFTKACCEALQAIPEVNAFIDGDEIVYNRYVNMGVAVGTPKGLIVPVVRNAHMMTLAEIELQIRDFALRGRDGKITPDDLTGGTFTVSNGGVYGSLMSTPILNPPQTGILGMHRIEKRPVVVNDKIEIRPMMYLALSYDHRIIDGAEAVTFLVKVKEAIEDPNRLLIQV